MEPIELFRFRLEELAVNWNPATVETDSSTNSSTVKEVTGESNNGPALRYFGDPNTSLLRVSTSWSLARLIRLTYVLFLGQAGLCLLIFGVTFVVYLWDLDVSAVGVVLVVISIGLAFCACTPVAA